ncbi:MAG TPA: ChbG/HpnK family deacetylase [Gemmataceae bacterium]|nr:ChbG/HpnK family deacetylase [Gemmataceae bacterium]
MMDGPRRHLLVTADDFGMGPATSEGILDAAECRVITSSVLLVNSPNAATAVQSWRQRGCPMELGWHPNLTLDAPVLPAVRVPSLTGPDGNFWPLHAFLRRWLIGRLRAEEIELELEAQLERFRELTWQDPTIVNTHQHVAVFPPVGQILFDVLQQNDCRPLVRKVRERWSTLVRVPGARIKRLLLNGLGRRLAAVQDARQFPCNDWLAGITDPQWVRRPDFFASWLRASTGNVVELMCHPGHWDDTLVGRDCRLGDGLQQRRVDELRMLQLPEFLDAVHEAGFTLAGPSQLMPRDLRHAIA